MSFWFIVPRATLLGAIQPTRPAVPRSGNLPILTHLHLHLANGVLTLTGTDTEIEIQTRVPVEKGEAGETTVSAHKLQALCRALPGSATILARLDGQRLLVQSHRGRYQLATLDPNLFPSFRLGDDAESIKLPADGLRRLLQTVVYAAARDDVRYYLNGVLLEIAGNILRAVASDGHRLAVDTQHLADPVAVERRVILPRRTVDVLLQLLPDEGDVDLTLTNSAARIVMGDVMLSTRLVEGRYPDWRRAVPQDEQASMTVAAEDLAAAVTRVSTLAHPDHRAMRLEFVDDRLRISADNPDQEHAEEYIDVDLSGKFDMVGYNGRYLREALERLHGEIHLRLLGFNQVAQLAAEPVESDRFYLIMPIRL